MKVGDRLSVTVAVHVGETIPLAGDIPGVILGQMAGEVLARLDDGEIVVVTGVVLE